MLNLTHIYFLLSYKTLKKIQHMFMMTTIPFSNDINDKNLDV